jgi:hypothetical protein
LQSCRVAELRSCGVVENTFYFVEINFRNSPK